MRIKRLKYLVAASAAVGGSAGANTAGMTGPALYIYQTTLCRTNGPNTDLGHGRRHPQQKYTSYVTTSFHTFDRSGSHRIKIQGQCKAQANCCCGCSQRARMKEFMDPSLCSCTTAIDTSHPRSKVRAWCDRALSASRH